MYHNNMKTELVSFLEKLQSFVEHLSWCRYEEAFQLVGCIEGLKSGYVENINSPFLLLTMCEQVNAEMSYIFDPASPSAHRQNIYSAYLRVLKDLDFLAGTMRDNWKAAVGKTKIKKEDSKKLPLAANGHLSSTKVNSKSRKRASSYASNAVNALKVVQEIPPLSLAFAQKHLTLLSVSTKLLEGLCSLVGYRLVLTACIRTIRDMFCIGGESCSPEKEASGGVASPSSSNSFLSGILSPHDPTPPAEPHAETTSGPAPTTKSRKSPGVHNEHRHHHHRSHVSRGTSHHREIELSDVMAALLRVATDASKTAGLSRYDGNAYHAIRWMLEKACLEASSLHCFLALRTALIHGNYLKTVSELSKLRSQVHAYEELVATNRTATKSPPKQSVGLSAPSPESSTIAGGLRKENDTSGNVSGCRLDLHARGSCGPAPASRFVPWIKSCLQWSQRALNVIFAEEMFRVSSIFPDWSQLNRALGKTVETSRGQESIASKNASFTAETWSAIGKQANANLETNTKSERIPNSFVDLSLMDLEFQRFVSKAKSTYKSVIVVVLLCCPSENSVQDHACIAPRKDMFPMPKIEPSLQQISILVSETDSSNIISRQVVESSTKKKKRSSIGARRGHEVPDLDTCPVDFTSDRWISSFPLLLHAWSAVGGLLNLEENLAAEKIMPASSHSEPNGVSRSCDVVGDAVTSTSAAATAVAPNVTLTHTIGSMILQGRTTSIDVEDHCESVVSRIRSPHAVGVSRIPGSNALVEITSFSVAKDQDDVLIPQEVVESYSHKSPLTPEVQDSGCCSMRWAVGGRRHELLRGHWETLSMVTKQWMKKQLETRDASTETNAPDNSSVKDGLVQSSKEHVPKSTKSNKGMRSRTPSREFSLGEASMTSNTNNDPAGNNDSSFFLLSSRGSSKSLLDEENIYDFEDIPIVEGEDLPLTPLSEVVSGRHSKNYEEPVDARCPVKKCVSSCFNRRLSGLIKLSPRNETSATSTEWSVAAATAAIPGQETSSRGFDGLNNVIAVG